MFVRLAYLSLLALSACADDPTVIGPFTGEKHRFVIDSIDLPDTVTASRGLAEDLDGNSLLDNELAMTIGSLNTYGDGQKHVTELLASGAIASSIVIEADDLQNDPTVGVTFYGSPENPGRVVGGRLVDGHFLPNRIREVDSTLVGTATLMLPVFADVDALELAAGALEIELDPNGDGYDLRVFGAARSDQLLETVHAAIEAQLLSHPEDHRSMWTLADLDLDGQITLDEMKEGLLGSLLAHDLEIRIDGLYQKVSSFGFRMHAKPCEVGACVDRNVAPTCFDRVRNGDETDVDCGGSCEIACGPLRSCSTGDDCQSGSCPSSFPGCTAPTCTDGIKNGLEASVDCGGACATKCPRGAVCGYGFDCASNNCSATTSTGTCR